MTTQLELGKMLKLKGMAKVQNHNQAWVDRFHRVAKFRLSALGSVNSEYVVDAIGLPPGNHNAVGAAMRSFAVQNNLVAVGYVRSQRASRHAGLIAIWGR